jgi:hypothetical protein
VQVARSVDLFSSSAMSTVLMNADRGPMRPAHLFGLARFLLKTRINPIKMRKRDNLVSSDPPRHDVMRKIVNRAFTPKRIEAWEPRAREIAAACLTKLQRVASNRRAARFIKLQPPERFTVQPCFASSATSASR